jgi:hypothetical protein
MEAAARKNILIRFMTHLIGTVRCSLLCNNFHAFIVSANPVKKSSISPDIQATGAKSQKKGEVW